MRLTCRFAVLCATVLSLCAIAASAASAVTVRTGSTSGPIYSGAIAGTTTGATSLATSWGGTVTCQHSHITGTVNGNNGTGTITNASWDSNTTLDANKMLNTQCTSSLLGTCTVATSPTTVSWPSTLNSTTSVTFTNTAVSVACGSVNCVYGGTVNGAVSNPSGSTPGKITFTNASVALVSGGFLCGSGAGTWNASYDITDGAGNFLYVA